MVDAAISLRGLTKKFWNPLLDKVDLDITKGEIFGLSGLNGTEQDQYNQDANHNAKPTSGKVAIWHDVRPRERCSQVLSCFRSLAIDSMITGRKNLNFHCCMYDTRGTLRKQTIDEVLRLVDLTDKACIKLEDYSRGMQR